MVKIITSTKLYRNEYYSMDTSASVSGGFKGFSASASAAYGEVNNLVTSSQDDRHTEKGTMTTYNPLDYQIQREVKTSIQIDGKTALYVEKRYVDSTSRGQKWNRTQLIANSKRKLSKEQILWRKRQNPRINLQDRNLCKGNMQQKMSRL